MYEDCPVNGFHMVSSNCKRRFLVRYCIEWVLPDARDPMNSMKAFHGIVLSGNSGGGWIIVVGVRTMSDDDKIAALERRIATLEDQTRPVPPVPDFLVIMSRVTKDFYNGPVVTWEKIDSAHQTRERAEARATYLTSRTKFGVEPNSFRMGSMRRHHYFNFLGRLTVTVRETTPWEMLTPEWEKHITDTYLDC